MINCKYCGVEIDKEHSQSCIIMKEEKELCVLCGKETEEYKSTHIDLRKNYIDGAGQLCNECADKIYKDN